MNAQDWLAEATKGMPEAVCARVGAETLAHLEDAGVGEGMDVRPVLGKPRAMRRELGRLYVPAHRLGVLRREPPFLSALGYFLWLLFTYLFPFVLFCFTLLDLGAVRDPAQAGLLGQVAWLLLELWLVGLLGTSRLPSERRRLWHGELSSAILFAGFCLGHLIDFLGGDRPSALRLVLVGLTPVFCCFLVWRAWHEDQRLRRTLALVGGAQF